MLKEKLAELVKPYIESSGFSEQDSLARVKVLLHQILNLIKVEVDKLTVLEDEESFVDYEVEYAKKLELHFPIAGEFRDACNREAQLKHTKKQLLDLMK